MPIKKLFCDKIKNILSQRSFLMNRREKRKMKKEINIWLVIITIMVLVIIGSFLYQKFHNSNPSEEEIQKGIFNQPKEKDV